MEDFIPNMLQDLDGKGITELLRISPEKYFIPLIKHADNGCEQCIKKLGKQYINRLYSACQKRGFYQLMLTFCRSQLDNYPEASGHSAYYLGFYTRRSTALGGPKKSIEYYEIGAKQGNTKCIRMLAEFQYRDGRDLKKSDPERAMAYFKKGNEYYEILAKMGYGTALFKIADLYSERAWCGYENDPEKVIKFCEMAAKAGKKKAAERLTFIYNKAESFNLEKAIEYSEKAIELGSDNGSMIHNLCDLYMSNNKFQNFARAKHLYSTYECQYFDEDGDDAEHWHTDGITNMFKYIPSEGYYNYYQALEFYYSEPNGKGYKQLRNLINTIATFKNTADANCNPKERFIEMLDIIEEMDLKKIYDGKIPQKLSFLHNYIAD